MSPHEAYYKGRTLKTTLPDWDSIKYDIMYDILKTKFEDPALKALLLNNKYIIIIIGDDVWIRNLLIIKRKLKKADLL